MKLFDLNLRGSGFTLLPFVNDEEHTKFRALISYLQCGEDEKAEVPKKFTFDPKEVDFCKSVPWFENETLEELGEWLVSSGYCTFEDTTYTFTEKAYSVFEKWAGENKRLLDEGFHYCPCQM